MTRNYRKHDEDLKQGTVRLAIENRKPLAQVATELGVNEGVSAQASSANGENAALIEWQRAEFGSVAGENTELRMQPDVLERSVAFWPELHN